MQLLITGGDGQLGKSLELQLKNHCNFQASFIDIEDLDLTDKEAVDSYFRNHSCDILINCAAYTAVDKAETEPEIAKAVNAGVVRNIADAAIRNNFKVIHLSTDYVFDGNSVKAYTEEDITNPQSVYGKTKLEGEKILRELLPESSLIIRTAWLYSQFGKNFYLTMKNKAIENEKVKVVDDQTGTPTNANDLARTILKIAGSDEWKPGVYHFSNLGSTTWYDFTREIYRLHGADPDLVNRIKTSELNSLAKRPKCSLLDKTKIMEAFHLNIPNWKDSLRQMKPE